MITPFNELLTKCGEALDVDDYTAARHYLKKLLLIDRNNKGVKYLKRYYEFCIHPVVDEEGNLISGAEVEAWESGIYNL